MGRTAGTLASGRGRACAVGVEVGKITINTFTILKVLLVLFMIGAGLAYFDSGNVTELTPFGFSGIVQ
jgi:hypothetical protein